MTTTVVCTRDGHNASVFKLVTGETDNDGTQELVKQYWKAGCGCEFEITHAFVPGEAGNA